MADHYQTGVNMDTMYSGRLLIAGPVLNSSPIFSRAVVYIYEHRVDGGEVMGVILNKPSQFRCSSLGLLKDIPFDPQLEETFVHKGGPVNDTSVLLLHTNEWQSTNTLQSGKDLAMTSDMLMIEKLSTGNVPKGWRMFAGMSVWTEDQLANEIKQGAWLFAQPNNHSVFDFNEEEQYLKALELCSKQTFSKYI